MISFLVGTIEEKKENLLVVDVNGVGYELTISNNTLASLPMEGETAKILTYLQVSENTGVCLYGFATEEEKAMFLKLITILNEDSVLLSKIKGLGKKSAERICLELKDKVVSNGIPLLDQNLAQNFNETALNDAVETLISLGVNKNEAYRLARSKATEEMTAEEIILKVLRELGR